MSHYMTALAMKQKGLKPAAKVVLYWIADHHHSETGQCNPSIKRLAECCEMSRRSVENHIASLEADGLIEVQQQYRAQGGKTSNSYTLRLSESDAQNLRMGSAKSAHGVCAKSAHDRTLEDTNLGTEQEISPATVFEVYNEIAERAGWPKVQAASKQREKAAAQRMKECGGFEAWREAMDRAAGSNFLSGKATGTTPASFDWLNNRNNFTKLMEGNYDNRDNNPNGPGRPSAGGRGNAMVDAFAAVAAERTARNARN